MVINMTEIFIKKNKIFIKKQDEIYSFKFVDLEKDFEEIMLQANLSKKDKFTVILDVKTREIEYYKDIFAFFNLRIKKLFKMEEYIKALNEEIVYLGEESSLHFDGKNIEELDVTYEDNYDFANIKTLYVNEENINEIFKTIAKVKLTNEIKNPYLIKNLILLICSIVILSLSFVISSTFFNVARLQKEINVIKNKKIKLDANIIATKTYIKNLQKEVEKNESLLIQDVNLSKKEYYTLIKYIIDSSKKGINFKRIDYGDKELILEGVADKYEGILQSFSTAKIDYLISLDEGIGFKVVINYE